MTDTREIEISSFILTYDGIYKINFEFENHKYFFQLFIEPWQLIKLIENEGLIDIIKQDDFYFSKVEFSRTTLEFSVYIKEKGKEGTRLNFCDSQSAEHYVDLGFYFVDCKIKSNE